jgi:hypothetical protein
LRSILKGAIYEGSSLLEDVEGNAAVGASVDAASAAVATAAAIADSNTNLVVGLAAGTSAGPLRGIFTARSSDDSARFAGPGSIPSTTSDVSLGSNSITGDGTTDVDNNPGTRPVINPLPGPVRGTFTARSSDDDPTRFAAPCYSSTDSDVMGHLTGDGTTKVDRSSDRLGGG